MAGDDGKITNLNVVRFNRQMDPAEFDPVTALDAAREWIAECENKPDHVIVLTGRVLENGSCGTRFFQAGQYKYHAQIGLIMEGLNMLRDNGKE